MSKVGTGNTIEDNKNATNQSFLYFMHEENIFNEKSKVKKKEEKIYIIKRLKYIYLKVEIK